MHDSTRLNDVVQISTLMKSSTGEIVTQQQQRRSASFVAGPAKMLQPAIARPHVAPGAVFIDNFPNNKVVLATELGIDPRNVKQDLPHRLRLMMGTLNWVHPKHGVACGALKASFRYADVGASRHIMQNHHDAAQ
jgi:hypothetical protein